MGNSRSFRRLTAAAVGAVGAAVALAPSVSAAPAPSTATGPSSTVAPYVLPVAPGVSITSLLSVGDAAGGYRMVGIPDGLGAMSGANGSVDVFMNHELGNALGIPRAHGQKGAFVSRWSIDPSSGTVLSGGDLITGVMDWDYNANGGLGAYESNTTSNAAFNRFCSASLTEDGQLLNKRSGNGYAGRLFFGSEESGDDARTFGIDVASGIAYQLPRIGKFSSENTLVASTKGDTTLVLGNEDGGNGQVRVYWGTKQATGTAVDKAGLTNGALHVLAVEGATKDVDFRSVFGKNVEVKASFPEISWNATGAAQNAEAASKGLTLNRIEDGAFDPRKPGDYYFVTTDGGQGIGNEGGGGGLWRLRFADVDRPELGGTLTLLLDGTEGVALNKPDNISVDNGGNILIQEDPGGVPAVARIVAYRIADGRTGVVAEFDRSLFAAGAPGLITIDEESSGIIDVSSLWKRPNTFLFDAQVHASAGDAALVEKGQLLTLSIQSWGQVYGG